MRKKKEEAAAPPPVNVEPAAGTPLTPRDIQEKVFKTQAGLRGYNEREVDEFLDRITEDFARLHAENQRLRAALAAGPAAAVAQAPPAPTAGDGAGQGITGEFVAREREFLKNLATLIQSHAEAVKQDIGRARATTAAPAQAPAPVQIPAASSPAPSPAPVPEPATVAAGEGAVAVGSVATEVALPLQQGSPEPAMVRAEAPSSQETPDEQTIRELFWGED
jgi:DivIVA domain-containing protein